MSREYIWQPGAYFHSNVRDAAESYELTSDEIGLGIADLLKALEPLVTAYAGYNEADNGFDYPLEMLVKQLPDLKKAIKRLEAYQQPVMVVIEQAKKRAIEEYVEKNL